METVPCGNCGAAVEFDYGVTSALPNQPFRAHAVCAACGWTNAKAEGSSLIDAQPPDDD